jgi:hypothetical protein
MEDIRDEDRGKETMVFEITSISLNAVLQFCVGNSYEHKGKDRYNVYLVKNGKVYGCVGHYDVEPGEETTDSGGKDFDVKKYQEPEWLIEPTSSLLTREVEKEKEKEKPAKEKPAPAEKPEVKSMFRVIITSTKGDCFYDSVVRADKDGYDEAKIKAFKEKLGAFMTTGENKKNVMEKYKELVGLKGTTTQTLIEDPYYRKYCEMRNAGTSDEDIVVQMRTDMAADATLAKKVDPDAFELLGNDDESPNKPMLTRDVAALSNEFIRDFFNNDTTLEGDDIIDAFLENFMQEKKWADAFIISQAAIFLNVIFLLLVEKGKRVEDYTVFNMQVQLEHPIDKDTQFIIADYQPQNHFKLIVQEPYVGKFTIDTLPQVIKDKFPLFKSTAEPAATGAEEAKEYEPVAVDVPKIPDVAVPNVAKYTAENLKGKTMKELSDILKAEFPNVPQSRVQKENGKQGLIDCILNPEEEKCKKLTKSKKATGGKSTRRV